MRITTPVNATWSPTFSCRRRRPKKISEHCSRFALGSLSINLLISYLYSIILPWNWQRSISYVHTQLSGGDILHVTGFLCGVSDDLDRYLLQVSECSLFRAIIQPRPEFSWQSCEIVMSNQRRRHTIMMDELLDIKLL